MRILVTFLAVLRPALLRVRMRGVVVAIRAILSVPVTLLAGAILVMSERHALSRRDGSHALDRDGQGQQCDSKNSEEGFRHRWGLYPVALSATLGVGSAQRRSTCGAGTSALTCRLPGRAAS